MPISNCTNEDCMRMMARYPDKYFDLAIVDPPYGSNDAINPKSSRNVHKAKRGNYKEFENQVPDIKYFDELFRVSKHWIVWGGNYFPITGGVIAWNKRSTAFGEGEIAICSTHNSVRFFDFTWNGMLQENMANKEERIHPTQKPIALYTWILNNYAKRGYKILDTHLGSGSSRVAAYKLGYDFWATELDKDYFEAQEKRFKKAINEPLFQTAPEPVQTKFF